MLISLSALIFLINFLAGLGESDILNFEVSYIGSVLCITFHLADGTLKKWYSSPKTLLKKPGPILFEVNALIPVCSTLAGGNPKV